MRDGTDGNPADGISRGPDSVIFAQVFRWPASKWRRLVIASGDDEAHVVGFLDPVESSAEVRKKIIFARVRLCAQREVPHLDGRVLGNHFLEYGKQIVFPDLLSVARYGNHIYELGARLRESRIVVVQSVSLARDLLKNMGCFFNSNLLNFRA